MIAINETSENEDQIIEENDKIVNEYIENIRKQFATVTPQLNQTDYISQFIIDFLNLPDTSGVEDKSIMIDDRLTDLDKDYLHMLILNLDKIINLNLGMSLTDGDIYLYYSIYQFFVTNIIDNMTNYFCGLQKLDIDYEEDIPNWNELSFEYFKKKIGDESPISVQQIYEYIDYIGDVGIIPDFLFEISLLESEGNVMLTDLLVESTNNRIYYDKEFVCLKLKKILSSDIIKSNIANKLFTIFEHPVESTIVIEHE
jgi:hypothetical protein